MSSATARSVRVLLDPLVDADAIDEASLGCGWALVNVFARTEDRPRHVVYATPDGAGLVAFVDDFRIDSRYAVIDGHDPDAVAEQLRSALPHRTLDEVLSSFDRDPVRALCCLGVIGPARACDPALSRVRAGLRASDESVRAAAGFAAEALGWPELNEPALDEPALDEPALDEPALDEPALHEPALDEPALDEPALAEDADG